MGNLEHWIAVGRGSQRGTGVKRSVTLHLGEFTLAVMRDLGREREVSLDTLMGRAARHYLNEHEARHGWLYPRFARPARPDTKPGDPETRTALTVELKGDLIRAVAKEAKRQHVSLDRLLEHAALYYLADAARGSGPDP
jgi:hypothetical protein